MMARQRSVWFVAAGLFTAVTLGLTALAQVRPAPAAPPRFALPAGPRVIETAQQKVRATVVARGIPHPFSLLVLPDGDMLVSERSSGKLHAIRQGVLDPKPLTGVPTVHIGFHAGLLDLAAHPKFSENRLIYFTYHKPAAEAGLYAIVLARGRFEGAGLTKVQDLWIGNTTRRSGGSRLIFANDGMIYITTGGRPAAGNRRTSTMFTARCCDSRMTGRCRPTTRSSDATAIGRRSSRSAIAITTDWRSIPSPRRSSRPSSARSAATRLT